MKKLLVLLILTLGISQTKLETRVYEINGSNQYLSTSDQYIYNLNDLLGFDVQFAHIVPYVNISQEEPHHQEIELHCEGQGYGSWLKYDKDGLHSSSNWNTMSCSEQGLTYNGVEGLWFQVDYNNLQYVVDSGIKLMITAEFPDMDTGYLDEEFDFCLSPGANLVSYPCDNPVPVDQALPGGAENFISTIIGEGQATQYNSDAGWVGSLSSFNAGSGYWFIANTDVCFQYECVAN